MPKRNFDDKLSSLLGETFRHESNEHMPVYRENRIFTNRNIKLARIEAIGFDMDFTLAQYKQDALDELTMKLALNTLVRDNGYPDEILEIPYEPAFAIRGLVVDTELGNVLKMDKFRYVSLAYHGLQPLDSSSRAELYNNAKRINFNKGRYRPVDTLFELLETYLLAAITDVMEKRGDWDQDYRKLYEDLRGAVDLCHRDDSLKKEIMAHPGDYIHDDPLLIPALHNFREAGKRLFVVTNSEANYTDFMLSYLFRSSAPFFKGWRDCFELVGAFARKPSFFEEENPADIHEEKPALFFSGGNIKFLESRLGIKGDQVLYVGDHIYGDILKSKLSSTWRTCMIVPELPEQIRAEDKIRPVLEELRTNEIRRNQITMELNWQRNQIHDLQQFKVTEADDLDLERLEMIDSRIHELNKQLEDNHKELSGLMFKSRTLRNTISNTFNPYWGRLFKTGGQLSLFAEQIRDYACIYTSSVSNFNFYPCSGYLENKVMPLPHEQGLITVGDLNFDASMCGGDASSEEAGDKSK